MSSSKPSLVVVPGAWHHPDAYETFVSHLVKAGFPTVVTKLPSCDTQQPESTSCLTDAEAVSKQILALIDTDGKDVVVVCHSYGGIPAASAASGLSKRARTNEGKNGGVIGLVYITAFVVPKNLSLLDVMGGKHAPYVDADQPFKYQCTIKGARDVLYNDLSDTEAEKLISSLRPTSMHAFDTSVPSTAWAEEEFEGKLAFVRCMYDQALPPFLQDMFMQKSGVEWTVKEIEASHSPFASKPEELTGILGDLVQQFVE